MLPVQAGQNWSRVNQSLKFRGGYLKIALLHRI